MKTQKVAVFNALLIDVLSFILKFLISKSLHVYYRAIFESLCLCKCDNILFRETCFHDMCFWFLFIIWFHLFTFYIFLQKSDKGFFSAHLVIKYLICFWLSDNLSNFLLKWLYMNTFGPSQGCFPDSTYCARQ